MTRHDRESLGRIGLVILALVAHTALTGCGATALDRGRTAIATTARAVAAADSVAADVIERRFAAVETPEQLERERERAERVVRAFVSVHAALLAADAALDAWEAGAGDEGSWLRAVACALPALLALADALESYDAPEVADGIRAAVGGLSILMGEECHAVD